MLFSEKSKSKIKSKSKRNSKCVKEGRVKKSKKNKIRIPVPQKPPKVEDDHKTYKRSKVKRIVKKKIEQDLTNND